MNLNLFNQSPISNIQKRTLDAATRIEQQESIIDVEFLHAVMCQVSLPRRHVDATSFERTNGLSSILIESGKLWHPSGQWIDQPLPSGAKPRLILTYISSQAVKNKKRTIEIGHSTREFLQTLGLDLSGHEYGRFQKQMKALAACRTTIGIANGTKSLTINTQPIEKFEAWCSPTDNQRTLWPGTIELSEPFFNSLMTHAVPLDKQAIGALKHSALCLDIYAWLAHRLHRIPKKNDLLLTWLQLKNQFGQEYKHQGSFNRKFINSLKQVLSVYPNARIENVDNGLLLKNSLPPVQKTKFLISTNINK